MPTEAMQFASVIERTAREIAAQIEGLSDDILNRPLPFADANTLAALATHSVGMGEYWVLALVGGRTIARDRPAEFRASGSAPALVRRFGRWIVDMRALLDTLPDEQMNRVVDPPASFRGPELPEVITVRDCLLHVVEHSATHLGHIQITRDLLLHQ
jgi:Protein of unknown function (DUF664)